MCQPTAPDTIQAGSSADDVGYPKNDVEGNDKGDYYNQDPYYIPTYKATLIDRDTPVIGVLHSGGAYPDTAELRVQFREFARLEISGVWFRISDLNGLANRNRMHVKLEKVDETIANQDIDKDGQKNKKLWRWIESDSYADETNNNF